MIAGVLEVTANPNTGSVLILYDRDPTVREEVGEALRSLDVLAEKDVFCPRRRQVSCGLALAFRIVEMLVIFGFEVMLRWTLGPLLVPRRC